MPSAFFIDINVYEDSDARYETPVNALLTASRTVIQRKTSA